MCVCVRGGLTVEADTPYTLVHPSCPFLKINVNMLPHTHHASGAYTGGLEEPDRERERTDM